MTVTVDDDLEYRVNNFDPAYYHLNPRLCISPPIHVDEGPADGYVLRSFRDQHREEHGPCT